MALPLRKFGSNYRPSSSSVQGINVVPAVIDPNFTLEIKIVVQPPYTKQFRSMQVSTIAQLAVSVSHYGKNNF